MEKIINRIADRIEQRPMDGQAYEDMYGMACECMKVDNAAGLKWMKWLAERCAVNIPRVAVYDLNTAKNIISTQKSALLAAAPYDFDSFLQYVEWAREPEKKFYMPRRKVLKQVVDALQDLADDKLDLLAISLPPGAGKLLADDTPIMTRDGWKMHGDLRVVPLVINDIYNVVWGGREFAGVTATENHLGQPMLTLVFDGPTTNYVYITSDSTNEVYNIEGFEEGTFELTINRRTSFVKPLADKFLPTTVPVIQSAQVGQTIAVKAVDENGKPTEWEAVDMSAGGKKYILSTTDMFTFTATNFTYDELRAELEAGNIVDVFVIMSDPDSKGFFPALLVGTGTDKIYISVGNGLDTYSIIMESDGSAYVPS